MRACLSARGEETGRRGAEEKREEQQKESVVYMYIPTWGWYLLGFLDEGRGRSTGSDSHSLSLSPRSALNYIQTTLEPECRWTDEFPVAYTVVSI